MGDRASDETFAAFSASRAVIAEAQHLLTSAYGLTEGAAFQFILDVHHRDGIPVTEIARRVVAGSVPPT